MLLNFEPITLDKQNEYLEHFDACPQKASEYSFVNLWGWKKEYSLSWAWSDGLIWIKQAVPEEVYWAPVGSWNEIKWDSCFHKYFMEQTVFARVPESLLLIWKKSLGNRIAMEDVRDHWDYLYSVSELVELKGNRFHKKKNLWNQFKRKYKYEYVPFRADMIDKAMAMQEDWCTWRDCESSEALSAENRAIARVLGDWEKLHTVTGGAIIAGQEIAAYTIAESLSKDILVIHFEKGNQDFKGVYQAINKMFLEHSGSKHKIVNRQQDLGDMGLRRAKLSYNPVEFVKKYRVIWK